MSSPCERKETIDFIRQDLKEVKDDVKTLLAFKNKALGILLIVPFLYQWVISKAPAFLATLIK